MKIACIDFKESESKTLRQIVSSAYKRCFSKCPHRSTAKIFISSREEVLKDKERIPEIIVLGPSLPLMGAYKAISRIRQARPSLPVIVFLKSEHRTPRIVKRFQSRCSAVFFDNSSPLHFDQLLTQIECSLYRRKAEERYQARFSALTQQNGVSISPAALGASSQRATLASERNAKVKLVRGQLLFSALKKDKEKMTSRFRRVASRSLFSAAAYRLQRSGKSSEPRSRS